MENKRHASNEFRRGANRTGLAVLSLCIPMLSAVASCSPAVTGGTGPPEPIGLDPAGCLNLVDHRDTSPIPLRGRLVVTYFEPALEASLCGWDDESNSYWCPYPTQVAQDCEEYDGTYWCPVPNPPADKIGDPQELGLFDLARPQDGVQRWTNNLLHEAEMDISPDGKKVVYAVRAYLDAFSDGQGDGIWIVNIDGSEPRRLTTGDGYAGIPAWVPPDSNRFTFVSDDAGAPISVFDLSTMKATPIVPQTQVNLMDPEPSYDGQKIVFKSDLERPNAPDIHVMRFDGSGVRRLTSGYSDHDPVFSPDNKKVYFERYYGPGSWDQYADLDRTEHPEINQWGIVEVDVETAEERVIIPHDPCGKHFFWLPTVSPDGQYLMFIHDYVDGDGGYQDLWVSDINGGNAQRVPNTREFYWFDWSD
jgi:Tol biopolymer transport system component